MARKKRGGVNPQDPEENGDDDSDSLKHSKLENGGKGQDDQKKRKTRNNRKKKKQNTTAPTADTSQQQTANYNNSTGTTAPPSLTSKRRRKRNRVAHLAAVQDDSLGNSSSANTAARSVVVAAPSIPLPINQYKTTLYRRAIRKRENDGSQPTSPSSSSQAPQQQQKNDEQQHQEEDDDQMKNQQQVVEEDNQYYQEEYGDTSLGMKLSVIGGRVIVQNLNSLSDGRASPAQISGLIQRGDVLLSIDNLSLVHLPIDLLMERLKPLSTPVDPVTGAYQRILHLRFAAGEGLDVLQKYEAAEKRKAHVTQSEEAANEVFSLFPMVDNLSGMPLFDNPATTMYSPVPKSSSASSSATTSQAHQYQYQEEKKQSDVESPESIRTASIKNHLSLQSASSPVAVSTANAQPMDQKSLNQVISSDLAVWSTFDRDKFISEFFAWNDHYSELLRPTVSHILTTAVKEMTNTNHKPLLTRSEMMELGRKALLGAELLSRNMESIDRGRDNRSFRSWNSSISLRSRASTRRRYVLDAVSLPVRLDSKAPPPGGASTPQRYQHEGASLATTDEESDNELDEVDGDALLLRLAAHDEIWRSQVIEALEKARDDLDKEVLAEEASTKNGDGSETKPNNNGDMDTALTEGLGAFLFGETMAKIVSQKKKSNALPPEEITAVLFDLSTNLASTMPDEITMSAGTNTGLLKASLVPFVGRKRPEAGSSVILATRFVLEEALVVWLQTFRPLPWESRRVLWPNAKRSQNGIDDARSANISDADSLTVDSPRTAHTSGTNESSAKQRKDLRQQIEDQELDEETRAETCFLVTYYFTQRLLPKSVAHYAPRNVNNASISQSSEDEKYAGELVDFIKKYGAYMKLHTCLAYAAALKCIDTIHELLQLAEHDLRHKEVVRLFSKRNAFILYEPTMLSAIVKCLPMIREERNKERRQMLVDICVSAYPDLCPWQVKQALIEFNAADENGLSVGLRDEFKDLYYYYLSSLLHPQDGHEAARHEGSLVEEWCVLSLEGKPEESSKRNNFFCVASRNSSNHLAYYRDLVMLLKLSMASHEVDLALELVGEILDNSRLTQKDSVLSLVLHNLRDIAHQALDKLHEDRLHITVHSLKRVIRLFQHMAHNSSERARHSIDVSDELHSLLEYKERSSAASSRDILDLINFFAKEAAPNDFLLALSKWTSEHEMLSETVHVLQTVLRRGARVALNTELSGSLLRLKRARRHFIGAADHVPQQASKREAPHFGGSGEGEQTLWSMMSKGQVAIDK